MGLSGLVAEVLLLREFLIVFSGNELSIGIVLANWLILEALGSFLLGRIAEKVQNQLETFTVITLLFFVFLLVTIFLVRILKRMMGLSIGESIGLIPMLYTSFLLLLPASTLHGALFTSSCQIYSLFSDQNAASVGRVYVYETVGTLVGGILCTYLLIPYLHTFQAAVWLALLNFSVCLALLVFHRKAGLFRKTMLVSLSALTILCGYGVSSGQVDALHRYSIQAQWQGHHVVHYQNSPYGNICVIENEGQYIFFEDGVPSLITPVPDIPSVEEFVHLPLLAHPEPRRILILSGGAGGVIYEALKHPTVETIEYAELDPLLIELVRRFSTPLTEAELGDKRVTIQYVDGRMYLGATQSAYDLILIGITEPSTLQTNRFFTSEFFALAKTKLDREGILVLGLPGSLTYSSEELKNLNRCIFNTLQSVFPAIRALPGDGTNLFLASDSPEVLAIDTTQVLERLEQRKIQTEVIIPWYIEQKLHPGWQAWFERFVAGSTQRINSDLAPIGVFYSIAHWNALFAPSLRWLFGQFEQISLEAVALLLVVFLVPYLLFRPRNPRYFRASLLWAVITTGFAGMIFDLIIIFAFQSVYGYVFSWIGFLVAAFMAGAAGGATLTTVVLERIGFGYFVKIELAVMGFALGCPLVLLVATPYSGSPDAFLLKLIFPTLACIGGFVIASQFPLANKLYWRESSGLMQTAGLLYAADLLGGWLGGIVGAAVLLPVLGLVGTSLAVAMLKL
ncbi:MAG: fused MFS/spermidine synthase, partial [Anaerolineae bacterium]|nr:fused MFS/spermidine synthase [Anaerolineae bacterium]